MRVHAPESEPPFVRWSNQSLTCRRCAPRSVSPPEADRLAADLARWLGSEPPAVDAPGWPTLWRRRSATPPCGQVDAAARVLAVVEYLSG